MARQRSICQAITLTWSPNKMKWADRNIRPFEFNCQKCGNLYLKYAQLLTNIPVCDIIKTQGKFYRNITKPPLSRNFTLIADFCYLAKSTQEKRRFLKQWNKHYMMPISLTFTILFENLRSSCAFSAYRIESYMSILTRSICLFDFWGYLTTQIFKKWERYEL